MSEEPSKSPKKVSNGNVDLSLTLGAHMRTTGGVSQALIGGKEIGCNCVQLFTASPQQWKARPLPDDEIQAFRGATIKTGLSPLIVHDSYLINLASGDPDLRKKSSQAFLDEMNRCEALGIDLLVTHCGASGKDSPEEGLRRLVESLSEIHRATEGYRVRITLEVTAGQGSSLGWRFEQIGQMLTQTVQSDRLAVCLDTCHAFVAGYDLRTAEACEKTLSEFDEHIGLDRLKAIHLNDALNDCGSRVDRHEHIGKGYIGPEGFRLLLQNPLLGGIPMVIETPDFELHEANLHVLRQLAESKFPVRMQQGKCIIESDPPAEITLAGPSPEAAKSKKRAN